MKYQIHITATALRDIERAADYIEYNLKNPDAAEDLLDEVESKINSLQDNPERFQIVDDPVLEYWGIRFISVGNYLAFYVVFNNEKQVHIVRFLHHRNDWQTTLRQGYSLK